MLIIFPGTGKTSIANQLATELNAVCLRIDTVSMFLKLL